FLAYISDPAGAVLRLRAVIVRAFLRCAELAQEYALRLDVIRLRPGAHAVEIGSNGGAALALEILLQLLSALCENGRLFGERRGSAHARLDLRPECLKFLRLCRIGESRRIRPNAGIVGGKMHALMREHIR